MAEAIIAFALADRKDVPGKTLGILLQVLPVEACPRLETYFQFTVLSLQLLVFEQLTQTDN